MTARLLRRLLSVLVVLAAVAAPVAAQDEAEPAPEAETYPGLVAQARAARNERRFDRARELYRSALALRPDSVEAREGQAACEDDHFWYGQTPVDFRVAVREDWQRAQSSRAGGVIAAALDPRYGARGGALGTGQTGIYHFDSYGQTERGSTEFTGAVASTTVVGPSGEGGRSRVMISGPRVPTVDPRGSGIGANVPRGVGAYSAGGGVRPDRSIGAGPAPLAPRTPTLAPQQPPRGVDPGPSSFAGSTPRDTGSRPRGPSGPDVGIAAAILGFVLPYVYENAVPLDLTLEPLGSTRASGFSAMFGFAPMRGAAVLEPGLWKVGLSYSNWFGTMDKDGEYNQTATGTPPSTIPVPATGSFFRYRNNRFDEGALLTEVGLGKGLELSFGLTLSSLKEGHGGSDLDASGTKVSDRNKVVFNRDGYVHVADVTRKANLGNLLGGLRWGYAWGSERDPWSGVGAALDVKVPLGDPDDFVTSGTIDLALTAIVTQVVVQGERPLYFHLNVGAMVPVGDDEFFEHPPAPNMTPAPPADDEVEARPALFFGVGLGWKVSRHIVFLAGAEGNASPYDAGDDAPAGLGEGTFGVADGLSFTAHLGVRVLFDKLFFEGSVGHDLGVGDVHGMTGRVAVALFFGGAERGGGGPARSRGIPIR